jgi:hypothetical protein
METMNVFKGVATQTPPGNPLALSRRTLGTAASRVDPLSVVGGNIVVGGPPASFDAFPHRGTEERGIRSSLSLPAPECQAMQNPAGHKDSAGLATSSPRHNGDQTRGGVHCF